MDITESDILSNEKEIFEFVFRKNIFIIIFIIILANGYSNIPGVNDILTYVFHNKLYRLIITFILLFQLIDNIKNSLIWSIIVWSILYVIEFNHKKIEKYLNNNNNNK